MKKILHGLKESVAITLPINVGCAILLGVVRSILLTLTTGIVVVPNGENVVFSIVFDFAIPSLMPQRIRSGSCLDLRKSLSGPHISWRKCLIRERELLESCHDPVQVRSISTFQESMIRLSCNTTRLVCVVLVASKNFSEMGMILPSARGSELEVQCDDDK